MTANGKLLHLRHHSHGRYSFLQSHNLWLKPTKVAASSSLKFLNCSRFSGGISRLLLIGKCGPGNLPLEWPSDHASEPPKNQVDISLMAILKGANSFLPQVVLASTVLALIYPPSFTWFTNRYYAAALGTGAIGLKTAKW